MSNKAGKDGRKEESRNELSQLPNQNLKEKADLNQKPGRIPPAMTKRKSNGSLHNDTEIEHHGVIFALHKKHLKALKWFRKISGDMMQVHFQRKGPDLIINNAYAPNSRAADFEKKEYGSWNRHSYSLNRTAHFKQHAGT